jgi:predicted metal-binding membrane protein
MTAVAPTTTRRPGSERPIVIGFLGTLAALCWAYLAFRALRMAPSDPGPLVVIGDVPPPAPYHPQELLRLFGLWSAITSAMMLPAATPAVVVFARVNRLYYAVRHPYLATTFFVSGYLLAWSGFGALATLLQWALHDAGALDASMAVPNATAAGLALVAAGVYQWTPAKYACLEQVRTPLAFVLTGWRPHVRGAFRMGMSYGLYSIGCCWLLTLLLFAAGVTNLAAAAGLTALVMAERRQAKGPWIATFAGLALLVWGTRMLFP